MKSQIKLILTALMLLFPFMSEGQELPKLKIAPEITVGKFPNGISYYLISNKAAQGYADYALVQRGVSDAARARASLESLSRFEGQKPYQFLASRGVGYAPEGCFETGEGYTMYRFADVPTSDVASSDTTMMMLFDFCSQCPTEQAIIISGDIDAATVKGKMSVFSLMVSKREAAAVPAPYVWNPEPEAKVVTTANNYDRLSFITASYALPRTAAADLNTIQTLVSGMLFSELDIVLEYRIREAFMESGIPLGSVSLSRVKPSDGPGDESYSISISVDKTDVDKAVGELGDVLADIDLTGISELELRDAREEYFSTLRKNALNTTMTNAQYVDRCAASYLFGTDLAPASSAKDFLLAKRLPAADELQLFNTFVSSIFDRAANLTFTVDTPIEPVAAEPAYAAFSSRWSGNHEKGFYRSHYADTVALVQPSGKVKLKSESSEPVSGGSLWTFANGVKVVYKKVPTPGLFEYALMVRGGYSSIQDLAQGEGPYVSDILGNFEIVGKSADEFSRMLRAHGITMTPEVGISDMRITGSAPSSRLPMVLSSLLSVAKDRSFDAGSFEYHVRCEKLRIEQAQMSIEGLCATVDGIMRPDFKDSPYKYSQNLSAALPSKSMPYFDRQFSKIDDGVLVLVGDLDPEQAKTVLGKYVGGFETSKILSQRPVSQYDLKSSMTTFERAAAHSEDVSVNVALSATIPLTAERYYAFRIAQMVLDKQLSKTLVESGYWSKIVDDCEFFPKERMSLLVSCRPASESGLPAGVSPKTVSEVLELVRKAVESAVSDKVPASDFKIYKSLLLRQIDYEIGHPDAILDAILTRYTFGKDMASKYKETINALSADMVEDVLAGLGNGVKVEYVVQ